MATLKQSTTYTRTFMMIATSDHISGLTGATVAVKLSKAGGTGAAAGGTVTEVDATNNPGLYKIALTTTDTGTVGDLAFHCTATSADPTDFIDQVQAQIFTDLTLSSGRVAITSNVQKNAALAGFTFTMTDSTSHAPVTGKTVTAQRSLDGAAFASCTNSVVELSNGDYTISLASGDLNGNNVMLRFTATGCDDVNIALITQP